LDGFTVSETSKKPKVSQDAVQIWSRIVIVLCNRRRVGLLSRRLLGGTDCARITRKHHPMADD
jgi:hypothetical protein